MSSASLRDRTQYLLVNRPRTLTIQQIAHDTGLTVHWLADFARSKRQNVSVVLVQTLYEYLAKKPLLTDCN